MNTAPEKEAGPPALPLRLIHTLVEEAVQTYVNQTAVVFGDTTITYYKLNERADQLARLITHRAPDAERIGVSTTRCIEMVIAVLAILKSGKAYLPLDPGYPVSRLEQMRDDAGLTTCLAPAADSELFTSLGIDVIDSGSPDAVDGPVALSQSSTACVLYTSGSTGVPKGVCLTHAGLVNMLQGQLTRSAAGPGLNTLQFCHLSFDASFQEIFVPLLSGGTVYLVTDAHRLDAGQLLSFIDQTPIHRAFLPYVVLQYLAEAAVAANSYPSALREVITGGELLKITPQIAQFFANLPQATLTNVYGPTETSVWVTELNLKGADALTWPELPTIGSPVADCQVLVLDDEQRLLPAGEVGELCIGGVCVADGYLNKPELTAERFINWTHPELGPSTLYRTGDLGRYLPDGTIEFHGRRDAQVKIRGNRVELGEIEVALANQPGVRQAVAVVREDVPGQKVIVAYIIEQEGALSETQRLAALRTILPDYMIPAQLVALPDFPRTTSGKVDRKALPAPPMRRPETALPYRKPKTRIEQQVAGIWSQLLLVEPVGADDNFFELGGNSLLAQKTVAAIKEIGLTLPVTKLYQYPTVAGVAQYVSGASTAPLTGVQSSNQTDQSLAQQPIAIIGMAGRFPGAETIDELWQVLVEGRETIRFFADQELDPAVSSRLRTDPTYVRARGVLENADQFDPTFFGLTPALTELMDPQQRVFLEIAWETLEQTGYLPQRFAGRVGVFAGCGQNTYFLNNVQTHPDLIEQVGAMNVATVNEKDYIASRTAYQLNLKGPAVSVYSACSTSLLAIAQAVQSLRNGQCEVALAGGASVTVPINSGHLYQEGSMLSRDGHTESFSAGSTGTVFSDGAGVVLLKPLAAAQHDGDTVFAVIRGVGVTNDGGDKGSFTAPSAEGQTGAIRQAITDANIDPATISYVEAHGTATPLGDPIEIEGLTMAFGDQPKKQYCAIGSIKSNMGHLTAAAGVAGLIKTALALHHRVLPPSINFRSPNPAIDFTYSPFRVNDRLTDWEVSEGLRRAGVSSLGVGGTNVHVILEEAPIPVAKTNTAGALARPAQLVTWSARTETSREAYGQRLADAVSAADGLAVADVAFTLHTTRPDFQQRRFAVVSTKQELIDALRSDPARTTTNKLRQAPDELVFLFPGQGAQFIGMGQAVYENEAVFRQAIDECATLLTDLLDMDIRAVMYPDMSSEAATDPKAEQRLNNTRYTQPALFVTEYALAKLWMSWGIEPTVLCGHSIGEFVAAHLAGVFSLPDALRLIASRGRLVSEQPRGRMLSVRASADTIHELLPDTLSIAAVNSRSLCVVAGPDEHLADFARLLDQRDIPNRLLATSHAFHSTMMNPVVPVFEEIVRQVTLHRPLRPIISTVTGKLMTDAQATDPHYWATHLRETVRFADAADTLLTFDQPLMLEVGPGQTLTTLVRQQAAPKQVTILPGLPSQLSEVDTCRAMLATLGQLWLHGATPNWANLYRDQQRKRVMLPTYVFDRKRYWVEPKLLPYASVPASVEKQIVTTDLPGQLIVPTPSQAKPIAPMRKEILQERILDLIERASGIDVTDVTPDMLFLEIGLDSLLLTQLAQTLKKEFNVPITFRQLTGEYATIDELATHLDEVLPETLYQPESAPAAPAPQPDPAPSQTISLPLSVGSGDDSPLGLIAQQLQILTKQVALLQGDSGNAQIISSNAPAIPAPTLSPGDIAKPDAVFITDVTPEEAIELKKPFGATARIERKASELTDAQRAFIQQLTIRYNQKTAGSKHYTAQHRPYMADPRVVSGFRPLTKELVYSIVVNKSKGSRLWDIDGNEYIDVLNGFGSTMFGYQPDFMKDALHQQVEAGYEIGPQHELAGEVSALIREFTGLDRVALCNTGSEAVLGAMRIARTVTGRSLIVAFTGSYHGIVDEVLVRGTKKLKTFPAASGIMPEAVQNILILDYGTDETLRIIRERADELAAVLVEPVQSRRPEFVPIDFLREVRAITEAADTALIFDEVITGFRAHPGGAQALFGIQADLAAYGKVVGGGLPIGVIAGKRAFMDALDGGHWEYGDDSVPEVGVTYFAGTFVRHPLSLAAAKASLLHMREMGPALQQNLTKKTNWLADAMNGFIKQRQLPMTVVHFGSLWKIKWLEEIPYAELLFTLMREKGIHIWDGFPCFMTEGHTDANLERILQCFIESVDELSKASFFVQKPGNNEPVLSNSVSYKAPPVMGARLGRDQHGNPAWFVPNPESPGKYLQVSAT